MLPQTVPIDKVPLDGQTPIRYSLSGIPLSPSEIRDLPTHLGLHHHSSSGSALSPDTPAGYSLYDLLRLSRSSAPAQRVSVLGILGKLFRNTYNAVFNSEEISMKDVYRNVDLHALRRDVFDSSIEAAAERGWIGRRALDVLWELIVGCTQVEMHLSNLDHFPSVDLTPPHGNMNLVDGPSFLLSHESATFLATLPIQRLSILLKFHLLAGYASQSPTYNAILDILYVLCHFSEHAKSLVDPDNDPGIISTIMTPHLSPLIGPDSVDPPNRKSIRILQALSRSNREVAQHLLGPADMLLRYVTTMQTELELNLIYGSMLQETLLFYTSLIRYGFFTSVFSTAHTHFSILLSRLHNLLWKDITGVTPLICIYLELLEASIVCATDPHQTTPRHDIVWSQIEAFGWMDEVFNLIGTIVELPTEHQTSNEVQLLWINILHVLAAWTEGAHLNGVKNGEKEKNRVVVALQPQISSGSLGILLRRDLELLEITFGDQQTNLASSEMLNLKPHIDLINAYLRLSLGSILPTSRLPLDLFVPSLCQISRSALENAAMSNIFGIVTATNVDKTLSEDLHISTRNISKLLFLILQVRSLSMDFSGADDFWIIDALRILHTFLPGDECSAQWIAQRICLKFTWSSLVQSLPGITDCRSQRGLDVLLPFWSDTFILGAVPNSVKRRCYYPSIWAKPEDVSRITSLQPPSLSTLRRQWSLYDPTLIFPLRSTWTLWPLDHLLRSGTSTVLRSLPSNWDATELEVVRATLLFTLVAQHLSKNYPSNLTSLSTMGRAETILASMRVFMLEHDQDRLETGEIYRDPIVEECLENLLSPFIFQNTRKGYISTDIDTSSLELASRLHLGRETPFYQFYTDFLALYDSVSFSHPLFAKLLLPPISLSYSSDYRSLFFGDYGHLLRTIDIEPGDILSSDIKEYLWPIERDPQIISSFLNALFKHTVRGFLRWYIIHHLAGNIWETSEGIDQNRPAKLFKVILSQSKAGIVHIKDLLCYHQTREELVFPPRCYDQDANLLDSRRHSLEKYDVSLRKTLENIFLQL